MGTVNCSTSSTTYYIFIVIYSAMSEVVRGIIEHHIVDEDADISKDTAYYKDDIFWVINKVPALLPIITGLFFLDHHGYKYMHRLPTLGLLVTSLICLLPHDHTSTAPLTAYYVAAVVDGLSGGLYLVLLGALYHTTKYSESRDLSQQLGRMIAAMLVGQGVSCVLIPYGLQSPKPTLVSVGVISILILTGSCVFANEKRDDSYNPELLERETDGYTRKEIIYIVVAVISLAVYETCNEAQFIATNILVTDANGINWPDMQVKAYKMLVYLSQALGNIILTPILVKQLYLNELTILMIALGFKVISLVLTSFAMESWIVYLNLPLEIASGPSLCCLLTVIIKLLNAADVGRTLSITVVTWITMESAGTILTTTTVLKLYTIFKGSAFLIISVVMVILFGLTLWLSLDLKAHKHRILLDSVKLEEEGDVGLETEAERWLLDAYHVDDSLEGEDNEGEEPEVPPAVPQA